MNHSAARLNESKPRRTSSTEKLGKAARSNEVVERARPQVQPAAHGHSSRDRTRQWPRHNSGDGTWSAGTLRETETKPRQTREDRWKLIEPKSQTKNQTRAKSNRWHGSPGEPKFRAMQRRRVVRDKQGFERRACHRRREKPWAKRFGGEKSRFNSKTFGRRRASGGLRNPGAWVSFPRRRAGASRRVP